LQQRVIVDKAEGCQPWGPDYCQQYTRASPGIDCHGNDTEQFARRRM